MPPKPKKEISKKQQQEKQKKIIEDKTFGLKNKKGAKAQKFIQQVQKSLSSQNKSHNNDKRKDDLSRSLNEYQQIVITSKKSKTNKDPKLILCSFFKAGNCNKGDECEYSHDLTIEKKLAKKDIYVDSRDVKSDQFKEDIEFNADKLKNFHICNYFLEAVESDKYGWFWVCPNGGDKCKYKHALPPGYKLKKDFKAEENVREQTLEELLALDKAKYTEYDPSKTGTPLTLERFNEWKEKFDKEMEKNEVKEKKSDKKMTGKEMFTTNPDLEAIDLEDTGVSIYDTIDIKNKKEIPLVEINENLFDEEFLDEEIPSDKDEYDVDLDKIKENLGQIKVE